MSNKLFRVVLSVKDRSVTGQGRTMRQAYGDAVSKDASQDWRPLFDEAHRAFKRDTLRMSSETVSGDLKVVIHRPWF